MNPLVSVVVPSYNRAYCVSDTVRSVLAQTYPNVEVLVVDDGSSDGTADVVARDFGQDSRVRYVRQTNQGVSAARNHGFKLAQGAYVALLDSDDLYLPWKLDLQIACMERYPELVMTWSDMEALAPDGTSIAPRYLRHMYYAYRAFDGNPPFERSQPLAEIAPNLAATVGSERLYTGNLFGPMMMGNLVHTSTTVLRKSALPGIGEFDMQFRRGGEDFDFHLRTCREGQVGLLDLPTIRYRTATEDSITHQRNNIFVARAFLHVISAAMARDGGRIRMPKKMLNDTFASAHSWIAEESLRHNERLEALRHSWHCIRRKPTNLRNYLLFGAAMVPQKVVKSGLGAYRWLRT